MPAPSKKPGSNSRGNQKPQPSKRPGSAKKAQAKPASTQVQMSGSALTQREFLLVAATAGWTVFVVEVIVLVVMFAAPAGPRPMPGGGFPHAGGDGGAGGGTDTPRVPIQVTHVEITDNPYKASKANVLGLPVTEPTTILLDAVEQSEPWLDEVKKGLFAGLTLRGPKNGVELLVLQDGKVRSFTDKPFTPGNAQEKPLQKFLDTVKAEGRGGFWTAIETGRDGKGKNFIFITPRSSGWSSVTSQLDKRLTPENGSKVVMEVVQMGKEVDALKKYVTGKNGGRYEAVDDDKFKEWK